MTGPPPLTGLKVLELGGLAPGPFCGLLLADNGASVLRIDRPTPGNAPTADLLTSHKASIALDLKSPASQSVFKSLIKHTDVLIDPFRPGVLEKLGLDPESVLRKINPRLIVVRLTGFRRDGKYKDMAGHDINYLAASGVLSMLGARNTPPLPPGNVLADFAGGGMVAFVGVLLALIHRSTSPTGAGQVVESNMVDGVSYLGTFPRLLTKESMWGSERGTNTLDGGCPYYGTYECRDGPGRYVSVGALEPQFFAALIKGLGFARGEEEVVPHPGLSRDDKKSWPYMRELFTRRFKEKTREEWERIFDGTDACVVPVLTHAEMEAQGYQQRPVVGLTGSPAREVKDPWKGKALRPGEGGEERLAEWMGWKKDKDFLVNDKGALELVGKSKL